MGEYAYNRNGDHIKIGTCEEMYYLRYEDKKDVVPDSSSGFGLRYRLPFPDEDSVGAGHYSPYNRTLPLCNFDGGQDFTDAAVAGPGVVQFKTDYGLLVNLKCYHGEKMPEGSADINFHWNGKNSAYALASVRVDEGRLHPVVCCQACGHKWRADWDSVLNAIPRHEADMRGRLEQYAEITDAR